MDVVCGFIEKNNRVLVARRPLHKNAGGLWEFPGGKVETGESFELALSRELKEELKIETRAFQALGSIKNSEKNFTLHAFLCDYKGSLLPQEHMALAWISLSSLKPYELCTSDLEFIKKYRDSLPPRWFK